MTTITRFTKEQLLKRLEEQMSSGRYALGFVQDSEILRDIEMDLSLAEIAKTSLEAEPEYWLSMHKFQSYLKFSRADAEHDVAENGGLCVVSLYTTPPAPVALDANGFLPCPFCNSPAKWCGENSADPEDDHACHHIQCTNPECGADFDFTYTGDDLLPDDPAVLDAMTTAELLQPLRAICKSRFNRRSDILQGKSENNEGEPTDDERIMTIEGILPPLNPDNSPVIPDGWIKCSERLPEDEQEVLTTNKMGHRFVSFFDEHSGLFFDRVNVAAACCIEHILVTHWMPLPAAPEQEVK